MIHLKNKEPFAFAGLWDSWRSVELGDVVHTFTIITTEANSLLRPIHNRMPLIYDRETGKQWLEQSFDSRAMNLAAVLRPWPAELMEVQDVSDLVNWPSLLASLPHESNEGLLVQDHRCSRPRGTEEFRLFPPDLYIASFELVLTRVGTQHSVRLSYCIIVIG